MITARSLLRGYLITAFTGLCLIAQVKITKNAAVITVDIDGKPFTDYYLAPDGNKPYLHPLRTASGIIVTRHYPMEDVPGETHDHPHHRGMFFSHGDVSGVNFWSTEPSGTSPRKGRMVVKKVLEAKGGAKSGTVKIVFEGQDQDGSPMMTETRTLVFYARPELRIVDFETKIDAIRELKFADTKEGTFGIRVATPLSEDKSGKMVNAEGAETEKNVWGKRSAWVDYFGPVEGKIVGIAVMDNPSNPHYPTRWLARAYGMLAANPFGAKEFTGDNSQDGSLTVKAGDSVAFRYRVVIHPGDVKQAKIASLYRDYTAGK